MTRFVMYKGKIYDLMDGALNTGTPVYRKKGYDVWSAEALLCEIEESSGTTVIKPFYFLDVIDDE